jgi:glucose/arabinose dehydrogenase
VITGRWLLTSLVVLVVGAFALSQAFVPRVRARLRPGWYEGTHLTLRPLIEGLREPTFVAGPPDGSDRLFILERHGQLRIAADGKLRPEPALDFSQDLSTGNEEGLLSLAFHPSFARNGYVYISYTAEDESLNVVRF